jgi:hypothetical protein
MSLQLSRKRQDSFNLPTVQKLAERAAYICSNPSCNRITIGPDQSTSGLSVKTGRAAHICAASPSGPRYDMSQTAGQRSGIENGIWLCATCADLIDKNGGPGYPVDHLRKWKRDHEALMQQCLEGSKRVMFQFLAQPKDTDLARRVLHLLEDKGALYQPYHSENNLHVIDSLKDLRSALTAIKGQIDPVSSLYIIVESMVSACRYYMNSTSLDASSKEIEFSLGALRKVIGINIKDLEKFYGLKASTDLRSIIPA